MIYRSMKNYPNSYFRNSGLDLSHLLYIRQIFQACRVTAGQRISENSTNSLSANQHICKVYRTTNEIVPLHSVCD